MNASLTVEELKAQIEKLQQQNSKLECQIVLQRNHYLNDLGRQISAVVLRAMEDIQRGITRPEWYHLVYPIYWSNYGGRVAEERSQAVTAMLWNTMLALNGDLNEAVLSGTKNDKVFIIAMNNRSVVISYDGGACIEVKVVTRLTV